MALGQLADLGSLISICTKKYFSKMEGAVDDNLLSTGCSSSEEPIWHKMRMIPAEATSTPQSDDKNI